MRTGGCGMEMSVMLLLLTPLTRALAFQYAHRAYTDALQPEHSIQMSDTVPLAAAVHSSFTHSELANTLLHQSTSDSLLQRILIQSKTARLRRRRGASKGCKLGTCQMHNLASSLYRIGQVNNKEQSKGAGDPNGYGR